MSNNNELPPLIKALMPPDYVSTNTQSITQDSLIQDGWYETNKKGLFFKSSESKKIEIYHSVTYGTSTLILPDFTKVNLNVPNMVVLNSLAMAFGLE